MRAPVRSSLANRGAEPSRQARESVHFSKNEKKTAFVKKIKRSGVLYLTDDSNCRLFTGILHKGDGTNIYLKEKPRKLLTVLGNGERREGNTVSLLL